MRGKASFPSNNLSEALGDRPALRELLDQRIKMIRACLASGLDGSPTGRRCRVKAACCRSRREYVCHLRAQCGLSGPAARDVPAAIAVCGSAPRGDCNLAISGRSVGTESMVKHPRGHIPRFRQYSVSRLWRAFCASCGSTCAISVKQ